MVSARVRSTPQSRLVPGQIDLDRLPKAGRRILAASAELFYQRGIGAVGVEEIALTAETTKKTIYDRFGSKEGLVTAYLQQRCRIWREYVADWLQRADSTGTDRVLEPLRALLSWMAKNDRGCGFVNAYAELAGTGHAGLPVIVEEKRAIRELYAQLLTEAGLDRVEERATQLGIVHEGLIQQLAAGQHPAAEQQAFALAALVVAAPY
ncbi:TetR/AcrR family transcriptional regulator [Microlunatus soli]|uniref:DNA-binding transcriptional regulator, AcrR family n=1 Tax=Microlunatus soli TaxID=630515 RepID=A0A1H1S7Y3_9ACTN|nr:TetR/AcrR family transcriptional regulator [Microlunatus soli]SDS44240.1 DNA-binding transcriptional regulator, AcrR family [Microlunatus soli]